MASPSSPSSSRSATTTPPRPITSRRPTWRALRDDDRFRFANHLAAWIEVADGRVVDHGHTGGGVLNNTHMRVGPMGFTFQAHAFPDLQPAPEVTESSVTFTQTAGGRPGMPAPRLVGRGRPALVAPTVWTTLRLELHADGRAEGTMVGATSFPRHWVYDHSGTVVSKSATISFDDWYERGPGTKGTPWGDEDSPRVRHHGRVGPRAGALHRPHGARPARRSVSCPKAPCSPSRATPPTSCS